MVDLFYGASMKDISRVASFDQNPNEAQKSKTNLSKHLMATLLFEKSFSEILTLECKAHSRRSAWLIYSTLDMNGACQEPGFT